MNKRERTKILRTALRALSEEHLVNAEGERRGYCLEGV